MTYLREFRDPATAQRLIAAIRARARAPLNVMEFCGGHTHAIMRYGLRDALAPGIRLLSGPGCPVCVTATADIDQCIALGRVPGVTLATFGDMIRVPGTRTSLQGARAEGCDVRVVYSALDALELARRLPEQQIVMLGIGFETTAPTIAAAIVQAEAEGLGNFFVYSMHKLTAPAIRAILDTGEVAVNAVLGPGHVAAITGWEAWSFLATDYRVSCAVAGFEPTDILQALLACADDSATGVPRLTNSYGRGVTAEGNLTAQRLMARVFTTTGAAWRGLGVIPNSGLGIAEEFDSFDARGRFGLAAMAAGTVDAESAAGCRCGEVLRGVVDPADCPLFDAVCTPSHPVGPCMVSAEGSCAAHYRYRGVSS
ncbi:MAG: hydrogenase formation protein HypD [Anaerolineae bacterium]